MLERAKHFSKALGIVQGNVSYNTVQLARAQFCLLNKNNKHKENIGAIWNHNTLFSDDSNGESVCVCVCVILYIYYSTDKGPKELVLLVYSSNYLHSQISIHLCNMQYQINCWTF